jgi:hypothetical protein
MKKLVPPAAAALALLGAAPAAFAATQIGEYLSFSGFGTVGAVQTDSDEGKFGRDRQPGGATKSASLDVDSNLGLQLTATATPWLSATVQGLAAMRDKAHIEPAVEWAFVTVKPIDGLSLRGGRMPNQVFAASDSRNIGYANTWLRAPNEVYALNTFQSIDGGDVTYRQTVGPVALSATGFAGKSKFTAFGQDGKVTGLKGLNLQVETDWATFRLGRLSADVDVPGAGIHRDGYTFSGLGVTVDRGNVVAQAEYVTRRASLPQSAPVVDADGWYVLGGYRFGAVLPYLIVASTKSKDTTGFPLRTSGEQKSTAFGLRWDAFKQAALKFQIERIDTNNTKGISFTTPQTPPALPFLPPGNAPITKPVTALSIALDFTF